MQLALPTLISYNGTPKVSMALCRRPHLLPRLRLRYLHSSDHAHHNIMVKCYLQLLSPRPVQRLRLYPLQHRPLALLWLCRLLIPPGRCLNLALAWAFPSSSHSTLILSQLAYEAYKAKKIIHSRDISYAFTNVMANKYYSLSKAAQRPLPSPSQR